MASGQLTMESFGLYKSALQSLSFHDQSIASEDFLENTAEGDTNLSEVSKLSSAAASAAELQELSNFPPNFPSVKRIPGTQFIVDGFRNAGPWSVSYFLSHFHSDHYTGLSNLWTKGLVFCSEITAHLLRDSLEVPNALIVPLAMGSPVVIDGCELTLVDANHCPGAVQFLFRLPTEDGEFKRYVHCGDMRFSPAMKDDTSLCYFMGADAVFLDTTYCNPKFVFPPQQTSVDYVANTIHKQRDADSHGVVVQEVAEGGGDGSNVDEDEEELNGAEFEEKGNVGESSGKNIINDAEEEETVYDWKNNADPDLERFRAQNAKLTLFLISTYVIGKEKILTAVAKKAKCKIYVTQKKLNILRRLNIEEIEVFTTDPRVTNVHVVKWSFLGETWPYFRPNFKNMENTLHEGGYNKVVGFVPTGWTYELKKKTFSVRKKGPFEIHLVPYSEHSNYDELREYVGFLRPKEIIPTVGLDGGGMDSKAVAAMRKHFRNLVDETASKRNFLKGFKRRTPEDALAPKVLFGRTATKRAKLVDADRTTGKDVEGFSAAPEDQCNSAVVAISHAGALERGMEAEGGTDQVEDVDTSGVELTAEYLEDAAETLVAIGGEMSVQDRQDGLSAETDKKQHLGDRLHTQETEAATSFRKVSNEVNLSQSASLSSSQRIAADKRKSTRPPLKNSPKPKKKAAASKTGKKSNSTFKSSKLSPKPSIPSNLPGSRNQKAMQSLISNFFKKPGQDLSKTGVELLNHKEQSMTTKKSTDLENMSKTPGLIVEKQNLNQASLTQPPVGMRKWTDEYEQLASILDENISQEQAQVFLEKAGGNVGMALDLYYAERRAAEENEQHQSPSHLRARPTCFTQPESSSDDKSKDLTHSNTDVRPVVEHASHDGNMSELQEDMTTRWAHQYQQLMTILDSSVSEEQAYDLLEKAGGDVGTAIDKFYANEGELEVNCKLGSVSAGQSGAPSEPDFKDAELPAKIVCGQPEPSSEIRPAKADAEKENLPMLPIPVNSATESTTLAPAPCGKKISVGAASGNSLEKKVSSVAVTVGKYSPVDDACWTVGEPAPYLHLARAFDLIEHESGRLKTTDMLCNMFRSLLALSPEALLPAMYLTTNRIAPDFENGELSIGGSLVASAIVEVAGVSRARLREMYATMGDLGDVAQAFRQTQSSLRLPPPLGICQVFSTLKQISKEGGSGSGARKKDLVLGLLRSCREKEMKYIVRTLIQNMRIGAMMKTVLAALAQAVVLHHSFPQHQAPEKALAKLKPKIQEASAAVVEAYNFLPNLDLIVPALTKDGIAGLSAEFTISPGTPIKPMLAKITNGISELLKRFQGQAFTCEFKYDGQRAQIHLLENGTMRIFSRDSADATGRFPDVINIIRDAAREDLKSFIIDAEVVAVDRESNNKLMAFQHLSTRERGSRDGSSVDVQSIKVHVGVFVFDIMFANNESLVKRPFHERRNCMRHWFPNVKPGYFGYAGEITIEAEEEPESVSQRIQGYMEEAFAASCEGLMAKALFEDSSYMASKRSDSWLKIKRDYVQGLQDSLDLVPIGAWYGNGRKAGWYSPFLLACYDPEQEVYQSVCRVMSGFTDAFYKEMTEFYSGDHILPRRPPYYRTGEEPSVWFTPELVWEIRGADFTISPVHQAAAGLIHPSRGISMRFPRFIRSRPDRKPEIASSPEDIADLFHKQTRKLDVPGSSTKVGHMQDAED